MFYMKRILVVDDEERIRRIYNELLASEGFKVIEASNAMQANGILKEQDIDLVLLDIKIPEVDGSELFEVIQLFHKKTKVIISSVYPLDKQREIIANAADYHDKSQGVGILIIKIKGALGEVDESKKYINH